MNREIKFRVWDLTAKRFCNLNSLYFETCLKPDSESGEMKFHGRLATSFCGAYKQGELATHILPGPTELGYTNGSDLPLYDTTKEGEKYVIQQFTGLKDKNGREIYEGDILGWIICNPGSYNNDEKKREEVSYIAHAQVKFGEYEEILNDEIAHGIGFYIEWKPKGWDYYRGNWMAGYESPIQQSLSSYGPINVDFLVVGNIDENPDLLK